MHRSPAARPGAPDDLGPGDGTARAAGPPAHGERVLWAPRDLPELGPDVAGDLPRYREWAARRQAERLAAATATDGLPEIALLLVVERADPGWLRRCLRSVAGQTAPAWRLHVAVVGPLDPAAEAVLAEELGALAARSELHRLPEGYGEAESVAALAANESPALALLGQDDQLAPDAVALLAGALAGADLAYADEDRVDAEGRASTPSLKPDWSPELCLSWSYLGRPLALRRELLEAAGGIRPLPGGDWEHDLVLRASEHSDRVAHVAEVLCHRREGTVARSYGDAAVVQALARRQDDATVAPGPLRGTWRLRRRPARGPTVSAIVPFRDAPVLLRAFVDSVTATAGEGDLELVLVDNGSVEPETLTLLERLAGRPGVVVHRDPQPFNWAALNNNAAADVARGEVLLFVNNDVEARHRGWLEALSAQALRPEVGVVGARLLYPSGRVQHAGMVLGLGGAAGHVLAGLAGDRPGYLGMAVLARDCSAVTGACLAVRREVFFDLGGFDESLGLDLNDVDLCLRARRCGLRVVYEPAAELVHHESPTRGTSGSTEDQRRFLDRWGDLVVAGDPFFNRNLTRVDCTAALRRGDEEEGWQQWRSTLTTS